MVNLTRLFSIVAIIGLVGCAAITEKSLQGQGVNALTEPELRMLFSRQRSVTWNNPQGQTATRTYFPDGRIEAGWTGGSNQGTYRINTKGVTCVSWRTGQEACSRTYMTGENRFTTFLASDGSYTGSGQLID